MEKLEKEEMVEIYGSKDVEKKGGVISFNVKGVHAHDVAQVLDSFGVAVRSGFHCAQPLVESLGQVAVVRMSFYVYNTKEEIDWIVEKLREVKKMLGR
jgi:cysteine desulfurase/selenocysteine lyase